MRAISYLLICLAMGLTTYWILLDESESADESLRLAVDDIECDCDDQLSLLLHSDAGFFVDELDKGNRLGNEELTKLAEYLCLDEVNIYDREGRVVSTTDPKLKPGDTPFQWNDQNLAPYRALLTGKRTTYRQRFRPSATAPDRHMKYFALALPQGGVLQVGFLWQTFEREFRRFFQSQFEYRKIGEHGFCLVLDGDDRLVQDAYGHPEVKGKSAQAIGLTSEQLATPLGEVFKATIFETPCRCLFYREKIANCKIMAAVPISERQRPAFMLAGGVAFVLFAAFLCFRFILKQFQKQQAKIDALRAKEESRRASDMALARAIQLAELRTDGTDGDGYRITSLMNAAREVGGDFYDYYQLHDGRLVITIADVSGKGVPAAFFMMKAKATLKSCVYESATLAEAVAEANLRLAKHNPAEMFVTAWVGVYDRANGAIDFVSAGHNPPLVKRENGDVEWIVGPRAAALGVFEQARYRGAKIRLAAGDRLLLYTDGVTEAMNARGELFGNDRLEATLKREPRELVAAVKAELAAFVGAAEQSDDITMLELETTSNQTKETRDEH